MLSRRMQLRGEAFEHALRSSEERFNLAVIGSNDGLWDWKVIAHEMYLSPRAKELMGYGDDELLNTPTVFMELMHPEDLAGVTAALKTHLRQDDLYDQEFRCRTK